MALLRRSSKAVSSLNVPPPRPAEVLRRHDGILRLASALPTPCHWVLAGGGAHGAVQLGTLQALRETDLVTDQLVGSSAGALTGALIAEDPVAAPSRLGYLWSGLELPDLIPQGWLGMVKPSNVSKPALTDSSAVLATFERVYRARDFQELVLPLVAVATDLDSGQPAALDRGDLLQALLASSAIPGVFPPVRIDGRWYIDGLASANLPVAVALARGARSIVVLDTGSSAARPVGTSLAQVVPAINAMLTAQQRVTSLVAAASEVPVLYLPTPTGLSGALNFADSVASARQAYELGQAFLIDLTHSVGGGHLPPGLYARPDAFVGGKGELKDLLRPVEVGESTRPPAGQPSDEAVT